MTFTIPYHDSLFVPPMQETTLLTLIPFQKYSHFNVSCLLRLSSLCCHSNFITSCRRIAPILCPMLTELKPSA